MSKKIISKTVEKSNEYDIETDEQLREHYHSIHNYIRNKLGLYGKSALVIFNFFFGLKRIENHIKNKKIKLTDKCLFSNLRKLKGQLLVDAVNDVLVEVFENDKLCKTLFAYLPFDKFKIKSDNDILAELIKKIDAIDTNKFDVAGRNFEYFIGDIGKKNKGSKSGSQIDDLGQYFTPRLFCNYVLTKVNPKLENKHVPSMTDTFCGSCGFISQYIRYLNFYNKNIDWEKEVSQLYGRELDDTLVKCDRIEMMSLTNSIPTSNDSSDNIIDSQNSFTDNFDKKFRYYITNPPYGGDKGKDKNDKVSLDSCNEQIKNVARSGCVRIKSKDTDSYKIKGDNKETASLLLGMALLEDKGTYAGVLKEGLFFDKKYAELRKHLIENYEVEWVVSIPSDAFDNTTVKTSMLVFHNKQPDKKKYKIKFCELKVENDKLFEMNPQTNEIIAEFIDSRYKLEKKTGKYLEIDYEDIKQNKYSLNYKNYIKEDIKVNKGFRLDKLRDICKINPVNDRKDLSDYYYVEIGDINDNKITNFTKMKKDDVPTGGKRTPYVNDILVGSVRPNSNKIVYFTENYYKENLLLSGAIYILRFSDHYVATYVYYYMINMLDEKLKLMGNGSSYPRISPEVLSKFEIPIPENIDTIKLYLDFLNPCNESLQSLQSLQSQKEKAICGLIKMLTTMGEKGVDYDEYILSTICELNPKSEKKEDEYIEYLDIGNCIDFNTQKLKNDSNLPSRAIKTVIENDVIISSVRPNNKNINLITKYNIKKNLIISSGYIICRPIKINSYYLYFYLLRDDITKFLVDKSTGSGYPAINVNDIKNMNIRILKPEIIKKYNLEQDFEFMDKLKNDIQNTLKNQETITKQMMKLVFDSTKQNKELEQTFEKEIAGENVQTEAVQKTIKPTTMKKQVTTTKPIEKVPEKEVEDPTSETIEDKTDTIVKMPLASIAQKMQKKVVLKTNPKK
jgi:type I restriction-modification system DNA methylase subunit